MNVREYIAENYGDDVLLLDPADQFDNCIVGMCWRCGIPPVAVYGVEKVVAALMDDDGMTHEEAVEYFDFNIAGAYMGESTPVFFRPIEELAA